MISLLALDITKCPEEFKSLENIAQGLYCHYLKELRKRIQKPLVLLITCDRIELYIEGEFYSFEVLERVLALNTIRIKDFRYSKYREDSIKHLLLLSTGIISPLFGEETIISQLVMAAELSRRTGVISSTLSRLFNMAIAFGKRIKSEYKLEDFDIEVAEKLALKVEDGSSILVIGSGNRARVVAELLKNKNKVVMTLRDKDKTFLLPVGVKAISYDERRTAVKDFDVVISATYGLYHTFEIEDFPLLKNKILFDIAPVVDLPQSFKAIRISDLTLDNQRHQRLYLDIERKADSEVESFVEYQNKAEIVPDVEDLAESISYEVVRRVASVIEKVDITEDKKKTLLDTISDSVRKAYISFELSKKR